MEILGSGRNAGQEAHELGKANPSRSPCAAVAVLDEDFPRIFSQNESRHLNRSILFGQKIFWKILGNGRNAGPEAHVLGMANPSRSPCAVFAVLNEDFPRIFSQNESHHWNRSILIGLKIFWETLRNSRKWSECRARGACAGNGKFLKSPLCCLCSS